MIIKKKFNDLTVDELYDFLKLRSEVFVVEQNCVYLDIDDVDKHAIHFFQEKDRKIVAYLRVYYDENGLAHIGRVVTSLNARNKGKSRLLMNEAINFIKLEGKHAIHLSGQSYLRAFYESLGFVISTELYLEDGIPHFGMDKKF